MVTLDVYSLTKTQKADSRNLMFMLAGVAILLTVSVVVGCLFVPEKLTYFILSWVVAIGGCVFVLLNKDKFIRSVPVADARLSVSGRGITFNSPEENIQAAPDAIESFRIVFGPLEKPESPIVSDEVAASRVVVRLADGREIARRIAIPTREAKKQLKADLEELRAAGVHKMRIDDSPNRG